MLTYGGKGYTPAFAANFDAIIARLGASEDILIVAGPDDVCAPLLCEKDAHCHNESVTKRDVLAAEAISIYPGETLTLTAERIAALRTAFASGTIRQACAGCEWHALCTEIADEGYGQTRLTML